MKATPGVSTLSYNTTYQKLTVTINGKQYVSAPYTATAKGGVAYATDGTYVTIETVFATWSTLVRTGHNFYVTHWELKSGTVR